MIFTSTLWSLTGFKSPAQGFDLVNFARVQLDKIQSLSQNPEVDARSVRLRQQVNSDANKDLMVKNMTITRSSSDKSLLNVEGQINNQSGQSHYVYYIVAKFVSKDTSIKQAIIPVNMTIEPGKSTPFTHEISTESLNSISPESVKPVVVKYEYR
jgi:uncharacterized protein YfdQ (DUF2303 family)